MDTVTDAPEADEDVWLRKAILQLQSGIQFAVKFLGKINLSQPISEQPENERYDVVCSCLEAVMRAAELEDGEAAVEFPQDPRTAKFLAGSKITAKNTEAQLTLYADAFTLTSFERPFARHRVNEIAFAQLAPRRSDVLGYYAIDRKARGTQESRWYYVVQCCGAEQILAAMKLAFTVHAEQGRPGGLSLTSVADAMTPSPTSPTCNSAYGLLRLSTPGEDGKSFIHHSRDIGLSHIRRSAREVAQTFGDVFVGRGDGSVTNVYLNVNLVGQNPYQDVLYPMMFSTYVDVPLALPSTQEEVETKFVNCNVDADSAMAVETEQPVEMAPPLLPKGPRLQRRLEREVRRAEALERLVHVHGEPRVARGHELALYPQVQLSAGSRAPEAPKPPARFPRFSGSAPTSSTTTKPAASQHRHRHKRVLFQPLAKSVGKRLSALRHKLGTLRVAGAGGGAPEDDLASSYTSLNSHSVDVSTASSSGASDLSDDSGVPEDESTLFVWPERPSEAPSWRKRLFRSERLLTLSPGRFSQLAEYLDEQPWFHGTVCRELAESRLVKHGEFLVRQSSAQPGQFILSVLRRRVAHHVRLVNEQGQIRSHCAEFGSVVQLVQFHFANRIPICSKTTAVRLRQPVARPLRFSRKER